MAKSHSHVSYHVTGLVQLVWLVTLLRENNRFSALYELYALCRDITNICHIYPGIIISIKWLLLPTGDEVHALYESLLKMPNVFMNALKWDHMARLPRPMPNVDQFWSILINAGSSRIDLGLIGIDQHWSALVSVYIDRHWPWEASRNPLVAAPDRHVVL